jgi:hypothetical protein
LQQQTNIMTININDTIYFKFSEHGRKLMQGMGEQLSKGMINSDLAKRLYQSEADKIIEDEEQNGYAEMQLWLFIRWFGPHVYNGAEAIAQDNIIHTEKPY